MAESSQIIIKNEPEQSRRISSRAIFVALSKMFTYSTRLADAWKASTKQVNQIKRKMISLQMRFLSRSYVLFIFTYLLMKVSLPACQSDEPEIEVIIPQGPTNSLGIKNRNIYKRMYKKLAAPIQMDEEYIYDSRYDTDENIAHILTNVTPTVSIAKQFYSRVTIVLRANASTMARNAYKLLGIPVLFSFRQPLCLT